MRGARTVTDPDLMARPFQKPPFEVFVITGGHIEDDALLMLHHVASVHSDPAPP